MAEGSIIADPHIENFKGQKFDFMGKHNQCFCMITTGTTQLNVLLIDTAVNFTVVIEAGLVISQPDAEPHNFTVVSTMYEPYYITVKHGNELIKVGQKKDFLTSLKDKNGDFVQGSVSLTHESALFNTGNFTINLTRCHCRVHALQGHPHLDITAKVNPIGFLSDGVLPHGVIGQSLYSTNKVVLEGEEEDYRVESLHSVDFKFKRFGLKQMVEPKFNMVTGMTALSIS